MGLKAQMSVSPSASSPPVTLAMKKQGFQRGQSRTRWKTDQSSLDRDAQFGRAQDGQVSVVRVPGGRDARVRSVEGGLRHGWTSLTWART